MTNIIPGLNPYIPPFKPLNNVTPFTYRDGLTYLEVLESLKEYLNDTIVVFINDNFELLGETFESEVNRMVGLVQEAIDSITENSEEFQDSVITGLVNDTESTVRAALDTLYADQTTDNATVASYVTEAGETKTALDAAYANQTTTDADVAAFVEDTESDTRGALDTLYADQTTDNATVASYITEAGETKTALDAAYANQTTTDADIAALIADDESATRIALDSAFSGGGLDDSGIATVVNDEGSATREALDTLYADQTTTDADVSAFVEDTESDTRDALDTLYADQETTDADIAAMVADTESDTRGALDTLYAGAAVVTNENGAVFIGDYEFTDESDDESSFAIMIGDTSGGGAPSVIIGVDTTDNSESPSVVIGNGAIVDTGASVSVAIGNNASVGENAALGVALGSYQNADGAYSTAIGGSGSTASGENSIAMGGATVTGDDSYGIGYSTVSGENSFGVGSVTVTDDNTTHFYGDRLIIGHTNEIVITQDQYAFWNINGLSVPAYYGEPDITNLEIGYVYIELTYASNGFIYIRTLVDDDPETWISSLIGNLSADFSIGFPQEYMPVGQMIFDTDSGQPLWLKTIDGVSEVDNVWVDATGTTIYPAP